MGLLDDCEKYFGTKSLYEVLSVEKTASAALLKKSFKKASLLCHPDKVEEGKKEEATRRFQTLAKVHYVLSDADRKAIYDETGMVDEEDSVSMDDSDPGFWDNYFRNIFPRVTEQQITDFFKRYKGSEEEEKDLMDCYNKYEGDLDKISECFIGYAFEEEDRICQVLNDLIKENRIPSFPKFVNESETKKTKRHKRQKKYKKEASELEAASVPEDLVSAMARRAGERERDFASMISGLEAKYGQKETGRKKKKH